MTSERDIEKVLDRWLAERPTQVADRVLDEVADRIGREPQQPAWLVWRDIHVIGYLKPLAAIAAVVLVAIIGFTWLRPSSGSNVGGPASPSPTPSPTASIAPSASAVFPTWYTQGGEGAGILPAGSQTTSNLSPGATFTVPEGWVNDSDYAPVYTLFPDTPANEAEYDLSKQTAQNVVVATTVENNMFAICDATGLFQGATAAEVIDAIVANEAFSTTEPVGVTIGGLSGRQVDVQLSPDWTGSCARNPNDPPTRDYRDARIRIFMVDTPEGRPIGIAISSLYSSDFETFLADAIPVVESFQFAVGPQASPS